MIIAPGLLAGNRNTNGSFNNLGSNANFWSSVQSGGNAWRRNLNSSEGRVNRNTDSKTNGFSVRCPQGLDLSMDSSELLYNLFRAYYDVRKHKRSTISALSFEVEYERNLLELYREICERQYRVRPGFCFVSKKPVLREVFAADFRDRVVHHLVYNAVSPIFERLFINDSYSCRMRKGTSYAIRRVGHFIRSCSDNYHRDCYVLKLDISGYFMSIDRALLFTIVSDTIHAYRGPKLFNADLMLYLLKTIIFHDPTKNCTIKGNTKDWTNLPRSKSLFCAKPGRGLPIGNLTSQLFGNVYLDDFDHFVQHTLGCRYYGRYVDDFIIIHRDKDYLRSIIPVISNYLETTRGLRIHQKKIYLQHVSHGVLWLGTFMKPYRTYIRRRTKGGIYATVRRWNAVIERERERVNARRHRSVCIERKLISGFAGSM